MAEPLHRHDVDRRPSLRSKGVERDAVTDVVERKAECAGRGALMLVYSGGGRARLGRRARDSEERDPREVPSASQAVDIATLGGCRSCLRLDARFDGGIDVDVVALELTVAAIQADAEAGERSPQGLRAVRHERGEFFRPRV